MGGPEPLSRVGLAEKVGKEVKKEEAMALTHPVRSIMPTPRPSTVLIIIIIINQNTAIHNLPSYHSINLSHQHT